MTTRPCRNQHPTPRAGCHLCALALSQPDYAAMWGEPPPDPGAVVPPLRPARVNSGACVHLGESVDGFRRSELKLAHSADWHDCEKLLIVVCPCGRCKTCSYFKRDE